LTPGFGASIAASNLFGFAFAEARASSEPQSFFDPVPDKALDCIKVT
jgi:hypothetical protein